VIVSGVIKFFALLTVTVALNAADATAFPSAEIKNRAITAKLYLPDPVKGYYRGTRFDWSGNTYSLKTKNHEYFGQWFPKYDPNLHDAIMGPVEEFKTAEGGLGYELAKPGETFVRIGVGVVRRPDAQPYEAFKTYEIVDNGRWQVKPKSDRITFVQELTGPNGYAYRYTKTMRLVKNEPRMLIEHSLRNTGTKRIQAQQYNHNFFVMDGQPSGPENWVKFPFDLHPVRPFTGDVGKTSGGEIHYTRELRQGQSVFGEFDGFGKTSSDYDIRMEQRKAGAGVRIRGDRPLAKVVFWSIRTVFCPEPYIDIDVEPGKTMNWTYTYDFYDLPK
jgi:hypothetical protein